MALKVLEEIKQCEEEAEELLSEAQREYAQIMKDGEATMEHNHAAMLERTRATREKLLSEAKARAEADAVEISKKHSAEKDALQRSAKGNMDKAAQFIIERIVNSNG